MDAHGVRQTERRGEREHQCILQQVRVARRERQRVTQAVAGRQRWPPHAAARHSHIDKTCLSVCLSVSACVCSD
jgi:hypothetical protein